MWLIASASQFEQVIGRLHPLLLHFPLALILVAAAIEAVRYMLGKREVASPAASVCLWIGFLMAIPTVWAGWELAEYGGDTGTLVGLHRWTAIASLVVMALAVGGVDHAADSGRRLGRNSCSDLACGSVCLWGWPVTSVLKWCGARIGCSGHSLRSRLRSLPSPPRSLPRHRHPRSSPLMSSPRVWAGQMSNQSCWRTARSATVPSDRRAACNWCHGQPCLPGLQRSKP